MYKSILCLLEVTDTDKVILQHVSELARCVGGKVTLLHVADGFVARNQSRLNLSDSEEMVRDRAYLAERARELTQSGISTETVLAQGEPWHEILEVSQAKQCDLIAMATHGHKFLGDLIFGSVAENIRHRTDVPILMIRAPKACA